MPCRSVLIQIRCLIRGMCNYEKIAHHCFYLIRKWKVIVLTPWLGGIGAEGLGAECLHPLGGLFQVGKDSGVRDLTTLFIYLLKCESKGLNFCQLLRLGSFLRQGRKRKQMRGPSSGVWQCSLYVVVVSIHAWPLPYPLSVQWNIASKARPNVLWRDGLEQEDLSWN